MKPTKRVLLIEDDPEYAQIVKTVLDDPEHSFDVKTARTLADGFELLSQFRPDVILLDLDLPDSSGYDTFLRLRACAKAKPIVVLTGLDDDHTALKTAENGAQDYLVKGLQQPKLIARSLNMALRRQVRVVAPMPSTHVIGFIGSKGGVGTSTIATNAAAHLAESGFETLIIEFQPGPGTLSTYLPAKPASGLNSLLGIPLGKLTHRDLQPVLLEIGPGLRSLCSGASRGASPPANAEYAQAILSAARQMCTYVVLDLPPRVDDGVAEALRLCDCIAVVVDREALSVCSAVEMLEEIRATGSEVSHLQVVAVDRRSPDVSLPLAEIFTRLKMRPVYVIPHAAPGISLSHSAKTPLAWLYPEDPFSVAIGDLTEQLVPSAPGLHATAPTPRSNLKRRHSALIPDLFLG